MNASPIPPSEKHVNYALCILGDKRFRPVYFHCDVGRDRTALIATLYEMYFRDIEAEFESVEKSMPTEKSRLLGISTYAAANFDRTA